MTLSVLSDNRTCDSRLEIEHGLSILLDNGKHKVLMDTGASDVFLRNAGIMGLDLRDVDYVFLSHGHKDHTGGLKYILTESPKAKVIVSPHSVRGNFYSCRGGFHGISPSWPIEDMEGRTILTQSDADIDGMKVITAIGSHHPFPKGNASLYVKNADELRADDFGHEIVLYVDGMLFTGCAHKGLLNILESCTLPVHTVVGGFHLLDSMSEEEEFETCDTLKDMASIIVDRYPQVTFYTGHCTGNKAYEIMKSVMGSQLRQFTCGMCLEI